MTWTRIWFGFRASNRWGEKQGIPETGFSVAGAVGCQHADASADPLPLMQGSYAFRHGRRLAILQCFMTPGDEPGQVVAVVRVKPEKQQGC